MIHNILDIKHVYYTQKQLVAILNDDLPTEMVL